MASLEIVHISDLHWNPRKPVDPKIVVDALLLDLKRLTDSKTIQPNLLVFSGDLVLAGESNEDFEEAYSKLIAPALEATGLSTERLLICPGNHDVARQVVRDSKFVEQGIKQTLRNVDAVNEFIDKLDAGDFNNLLAVQRMDNYYSFLRGKMPTDASSTHLMKTRTFEINGLKVGAACFDTAWRATGEADDVDRGSLLLGERNVDNAIAALVACDVSLAVMHHPLDWLADFDEIAVSSRLSANFDAMFCGHTHRLVPQTRTTAHGTAILSQTGSIYAGRRWFNGFQSVKLSQDDETCTFIVRSYYDTPRREFDAATNVMQNGTITFPYAPQKKTSDNLLIENFLRGVRLNIREAATEHLNMLGLDTISTSDVKDSFIVPPLTLKSQVSSDVDEEDNTDINDKEGMDSVRDDIELEAILRSQDSYLIIGGRESGKTSFLHYMAVLCAEGVSDIPRVPVILNANTLKPGDYQLKRAITSYFGVMPKKCDIDHILKIGGFIFLVDNFVEDDELSAVVQGHIEDNKECRWILITKPRDGSVTGDIKPPRGPLKLQTVRMGSLPRRSIRALSKKWAAAIGSGDEEIFEAVMKQLKKDGLPRTGYMVTLILWAMKQEKELDRVNEAMLLSNVVDYLLGKTDFTQSVRGRLDPRAKELTLEFLAEHLTNNSQSVSVDDAISFLSELFKRRRLPFVAADVLSELIKCGILDRTDDFVEFKYSSFREYFFALRMKSDSRLFSSTLFEKRYLDRSREIEMLAGLRRENADIISVIHRDMEVLEPLDFSNLSKDAIAGVIDRSLGLDVSKKQLSDLRRKRLTADQVDDLLDAADRRAIAAKDKQEQQERSAAAELGVDKSSQETTVNSELFTVTEYLLAADLLARVTKNSDFSDFDAKAPAVLAVLNTGSKVCALIRSEVEKMLKEPGSGSDIIPLDEKEQRFMLYYITKIIASTVSDHITDILASPNIGPMIDELMQLDNVLVVEKVFSAFLLQSVRNPEWESRWSELLEEDKVSGFVVELITRKMRSIVETQFLDDREYRKLHTVIDTAERVLGWTNEQKGEVLTDLRKVRTQADLRDATATTL